jgi:hypothetical protein
MNNTEESNAVIAAAEAQAACYTGDPRLDECFKADIMNAFFAGSTFQKEQAVDRLREIISERKNMLKRQVEVEAQDRLTGNYTYYDAELAGYRIKLLRALDKLVEEF